MIFEEEQAKAVAEAPWTPGEIIVATVIPFALFIAIGFIITQYRKSKTTDEVVKSKLGQTQVILFAAAGIVALLYIAGILVHAFNSGGKFLLNLSATIIVAWIVMLICYYVWAIYFYNINLGWSDDKWRRARDTEEDPSAETDAPNRNPHSEETLGLPPGTVRGTIALTLLVGGLALTVGSFGMETSISSNQVLVDNFDFYKEAFIMMIAFYFGVKSLDILRGNQKQKPAAQGGGTNGDGGGGGAQKAEKADVTAEKLQSDFSRPGSEG